MSINPAFKEKLRKRSYELALKVIYVHKNISVNYNEKALSTRFLEEGTRVGEFIVEAMDTSINLDIHYLLSKAYQSLGKTNYWLHLLHESGLVEMDSFNALAGEIGALRSLIEECQNASAKP